jgi:orotate phosphoribosyltransferase
VGCELVALASIEVESFAPDEIPDDLKAIPAIKPGSRALSQGASA